MIKIDHGSDDGIKKTKQGTISSFHAHANARIYFSPLPNLRASGLETKREKVFFSYWLPTIALAVFRILILSWKNRKGVNKLRYIFQRSRLAVF